MTKASASRAARSARVVRFVSDYPFGGRATYGLQPVYHNLSRTQAKNGHEVHVIARRYEGQPAEEQVDGVNVHRVGFPYVITSPATLRRLLGGNETGVIHTHSTSGLTAAVPRRIVRAPVVSHVHGTTYSAATPVVMSFGETRMGYSHWRVSTSYLRERALWSSADRVAAVSSSVVADLESRYHVEPDDIRLVYNGVDPGLFKPVPPLESIGGVPIEGKQVILYVGHFGLRKGLPFLIRAMKRVAAESSDAILVCIGGIPPWLPHGKYLAYLRQLVGEQGLEGKVVFSERVDQDKLPRIYSSASLFVLPSYYEAFPKVLIEAMACEKAVITTDLGGTRDSVEDGVNGFLVPYANPPELADRMVRLLQDDKLSRQMGRNGRQKVLGNFTWQAVSERIDAIYEELLSN